MSPQTQAKPLDPYAVKAMLSDGRELALIDLREELIFSRNHLLWARSIPLSRLELRFARLVPRRATRIVLIDDADGLAERAAKVLGAAGYSDLHILDGGDAALQITDVGIARGGEDVGGALDQAVAVVAQHDAGIAARHETRETQLQP